MTRGYSRQARARFRAFHGVSAVAFAVLGVLLFASVVADTASTGFDGGELLALVLVAACLFMVGFNVTRYEANREEDDT